MYGEAIGLGRTPVVALSYLLVVARLLCTQYAVAVLNPVEAHALHGAVPAK